MSAARPLPRSCEDAVAAPSERQRALSSVLTLEADDAALMGWSNNRFNNLHVILSLETDK